MQKSGKSSANKDTDLNSQKTNSKTIINSLKMSNDFNCQYIDSAKLRDYLKNDFD